MEVQVLFPAQIFSGRLAQLVERLVYIEDVVGPSPTAATVSFKKLTQHIHKKYGGKMKRYLLLMTAAILVITSLACSIQVPLTDPTATLPPPRVTTIEPTITPSLPAPTPPFEACNDPAVTTYFEESERLVLRYAKLSRQFQGSFDASDKEAMRLDLENVRQITAEIEALAPPPLYATYHSLLSEEMRGFTDVMAAVLDDDVDLAKAIAAETDMLDAKRLAETDRINHFCRPPILRKEA